jgi:hypothetical protein
VVLGEDAFGLFDDDAAGEGGLQLLVEDLAAADGAFLEDADGGDVGEGLAEGEVGGGSGPGVWWNRFSAPMASRRSRSGSACTDRNPPASATAAVKAGHWVARVRSGTLTGVAVR